MKLLITCIMFMGFGAMADNVADMDLIIQRDQVKAEAKAWTVELNSIAHSVYGTASPLVGPALFTHFSALPDERVGLRSLLAPTKAIDEGAYALHLVWQHSLTHSRSPLYLEANLGYNMVRVEEFFSGGSSVGIMHHLDETLSIGGSAGFELAPKLVKAETIETKGTFYVYPKISVFAGIDF